MSEFSGTADVAVLRNVSFDTHLSDPRIADLIRHALAEERETGDWQLAIAFVGLDEISQLHARFMGQTEPTDILTFPFGEAGVAGGDIAVCVPVASEQGAEHGNSLDDELAFLILHGVLHLIGYDDATDVGRTAMLDRQQEILDSWKRLRV